MRTTVLLPAVLAAAAPAGVALATAPLQAVRGGADRTPAARAELPHPPLPAASGDAIESDWRPIADDDLMIVTLAGERRVVVRLATGYAPEHVANVRRLARAHWWDATSVYRVQDNWVAQWGGAPTDAEEKPLPADVVRRPAAEFDIAAGFRPAQYLGVNDAYSGASGITADGWAIATARPGEGRREPDAAVGWLAHCYGTLGVARDALPDTGSGGELFMPIGGSARRLDRNYTIVGRVIEGAQYLAGLPRSAAAMGLYASAAERVPIVSVRLASDLPPGERPRFQYRAADNPRFAAMIAAKRAPAPPMVGLGGLDVCDVPLPVRRVP